MDETANAAGDSFLAGFDASRLLNLLADGAYITDSDRKIVYWNRAAEKISGWKAEEVVGRKCRDNILVHVDKDGHELCGQEHCPLHRSILTGKPSAEPMLVFAQHPTNGRVPVEVTVSPIRNPAGEIIGGIEMFRDLTDSVQDQLRAKEIQERAVHSEFPPDSRVDFEVRYQPRDLVGGDFFRIEKLDDDRYVILLADVRGHGMSAALYTMFLRSLWDEHRRDQASPANLLRIINERLLDIVFDMGFFGTAVLASYHAGSGELCLVRAGHPAPLLFRTDGTTESIGSANPALGLQTGETYTETTLNLSPGDAVLLYTDGATEVSDGNDRELGRDGLLHLARLQPQDGNTGFHLSQLEEQLLRYSNQIHLADDLTLIKLHRLS